MTVTGTVQPRFLQSWRTPAAGGAEAILIATNTMHKMADDISAASNLILHIADATANAIKASGSRAHFACDGVHNGTRFL